MPTNRVNASHDTNKYFFRVLTLPQDGDTIIPSSNDDRSNLRDQMRRQQTKATNGEPRL